VKSLFGSENTTSPVICNEGNHEDQVPLKLLLILKV
jgi:hypothetical protein